jgi:hypothetical protein
MLKELLNLEGKLPKLLRGLEIVEVSGGGELFQGTNQ